MQQDLSFGDLHKDETFTYETHQNNQEQKLGNNLNKEYIILLNQLNQNQERINNLNQIELNQFNKQQERIIDQTEKSPFKSRKSIKIENSFYEKQDQSFQKSNEPSQIQLNDSNIQNQVESYTKNDSNFELQLNYHENYQGMAIQLIYLKNNQIQFNQEFFDSIVELNQKVAFFSVIGIHNSAKTSLLNGLIGGNNLQGFGCEFTKGIWVWSEPLINHETNTKIFILDCQGFKQSSKYNHENIFKIKSLQEAYFIYMSLIMSSYAFFNIKDHFENQFFQILSVLNMFDDDFANINKFMPEILVTLRDNLNINQKQNDLPIKNQFEMFLTKYTQNDHKYSLIQKFLQLFHKRDCIQLNPILNESNNILQQSVSQEFQHDTLILWNKIIQICKQKTYNGKNIELNILQQLIVELIDNFNDTQKLYVIENFNKVINNSYLNSYQECINYYNHEMQLNFLEDKSYSSFQLIQILKNMRTQSFARYQCVNYTHNYQKYTEYREKLIQYIEQKEKQAFLINQQISKIQAVSQYEKISRNIIQKASNEEYSKNDLNNHQNDLYQLFEKFEFDGHKETLSEVFFKEFAQSYQLLIKQFFEKQILNILDEQNKQTNAQEILNLYKQLDELKQIINEKKKKILKSINLEQQLIQQQDRMISIKQKLQNK